MCLEYKLSGCDARDTHDTTSARRDVMAARRRFPSATASSVAPMQPSGLASPLRAYLRAEFAHALRASKGTRTPAESLSLSGPTPDGGPDTADSAAAGEAVGFAPDERKTEAGDGGATAESTSASVTKPARDPASSPESGLPRDYLVCSPVASPPSPSFLTCVCSHAWPQRCEEVCTLAPPQDLPVRFSHLAVLFAIDANRDGRFSFRVRPGSRRRAVARRATCSSHGGDVTGARGVH